MADKGVYIAFGGDTGSLEAAAARAQAAVRATTREMTRVAAEMQKTGASAESELGLKLSVLGEQLSRAKTEAGSAREAMAKLGAVAGESAHGVEAAGHAHGFNNVQMLESIHVVKALADEIAAGSNPLRALAVEGGRIFQILSMGVSASVVGWGAVAAGALAAAGSVAYLVFQAHEFAATSEKLRNASAFGGMALTPGQSDAVTRELQKISGLSWDEAKKVGEAFGLMQTKSREVFAAIAADIDGFAKATGEKPEAAAKALIALFDNQKLSADELAKAVGGLDEAQRSQYERALAAADPTERQAALQAILAQKLAATRVETLKLKEAQLAAAQARKSADDAEIERNSELAGYARNDAAAAELVIETLRKQIDALRAANDEAAKMPDLIRQSSSAAELLKIKFDEVLKSVSGATEAAHTAANIETLRAGLQGATGDAAALIRKFEGFRQTAYMDRSPGHPELDHWAVGYGQHAVNGAEVTQGTVVSREDAEADLARRIANIQSGLEASLGASWSTISDKAKASLTSIAYNYGSLPGNVLAAARTGDEKAIADAIAARAGDNNGVNAGRRAQEAANITRDDAVVTDPAKISAARDAMAELADKQKARTDARNGGNAVDLATLRNLEQDAVARGDAVAQQRAIVAAREQELAALQSVQGRAGALKALDEARLELRNRENAATQSGLQLESARAKGTGDIARQRAAELALADFRIAQAGSDVAARNAAEAEKLAVVQRFDEQSKQLAMQGAQERIAAARAETQAKIKDLDLELKARQITEAQKFAQTQAAYAKERAATLAAFQSELQLDNLKPRERQRLLAEIETAEREFAQRSKQIQLEAADSSAKAWLAGADKIAGILDSQVSGVLHGTTSMRQAFANMAASAIEDIIKLGLKWAAENIAMTAATLVATATQTATIGAGAAAQKTINLATVQGDAGRAAAGAYAAVAGIPLIGPALAPAAAAVAYAGTMAFASADIGMWNVPGDQFALVHHNELIMPAAQAGAFRDMLSNHGPQGNSGAGNLSFGDIHAHPAPGQKMDGATLFRQVMREARRSGYRMTPNERARFAV